MNQPDDTDPVAGSEVDPGEDTITSKTAQPIKPDETAPKAADVRVGQYPTAPPGGGGPPPPG